MSDKTINQLPAQLLANQSSTDSFPLQTAVGATLKGTRGDLFYNINSQIATLTSTVNDLVFSVKEYGAVGDGKQINDGSIGSGSNLLNSATANFTNADIGKRVWVRGAGTSWNSELWDTYITARGSSTQVTLHDAASHSVSGATFYYGTNDFPAFQAAVDAASSAGGGTVFIPPGIYIVPGDLTLNFPNITIQGTGTGSYLAMAQAISIYTYNIKIRDFGNIGIGAIAIHPVASLVEISGIDYTSVYSQDITVEAGGDPPGSIAAQDVDIHDNYLRHTTGTSVECVIVMAAVKDVNFHDNYVYNQAGGGFACYGAPGQVTPIRNVRCHNNLFELGGAGFNTATSISGIGCSVTNNHYLLTGPAGINVQSDQEPDGGVGPPWPLWAIDIVISGNVIESSAGAGNPLVVNKGVFGGVGTTKNIVITYNTITGGTPPVQLCGDDILFSYNTVDGLNDSNTTIQLGYIADMKNIEISHNVIKNSGNQLGDIRPAIESYTETGQLSNITGLKILDNTIYDELVAPTTAYGILINSSGGKTVTDVHIEGNTIYNTYYSGIFFENTSNGSISGNTVRDCAVTGAAAGIHIGNATYIDMQNNRVYDTGSPKTQTYGILEDGSSDNNLISNNDLRGNLTSGLSKVGASTVARQNLGSTVDAQVLATGAAHTVDDVITALQAQDVLRQS